MPGPQALVTGWAKVAHRAEGYPYEVSRDGRVRRADTGKVLHPFDGGPNGEYARVELTTPELEPLQVYVHQLVAWSWLPGDPVGVVVDHIDGDPRNNRAGNLRYLDARENMKRHRRPR